MACGALLVVMRLTLTTPSLKESDDLSVRLNGHALRRRLLGKPGHRHDVARLRDDEARTRRWIDIVDGDAKSGRPAQFGRVVAQRVLCLRHADGCRAKPDALKILDRTVSLGRVLGTIASIHFPHDRLDLLLDRARGVVERGVAALSLGEHRLNLAGQRLAAGTSLLPYLGQRDAGPGRARPIRDHRELALAVGHESVERDDHRETELAHVLDVLVEVR